MRGRACFGIGSSGGGSAPSGGGAGALVWRPDDPSPGSNVYVDWNDLWDVYEPLVGNGAPDIIIDTRLVSSPATLPAKTGGGIYVFDSNTALRGVLDILSREVDLADGVKFKGLGLITDGLDLVSKSTDPIITIEDDDSGVILRLIGGVTLKADGTAPFVLVDTDFLVSSRAAAFGIDQDCSLLTGAAPICEVDSGIAGFGLIFTGFQGRGVIEDDVFASAANAGWSYQVSAGSVEISFVQPSFGGTIFNRSDENLTFNLDGGVPSGAFSATPGRLHRYDPGAGYVISIPAADKAIRGLALSLKNVTASATGVTITPAAGTVEGGATLVRAGARLSTVLVPAPDTNEWLLVGA